MPQKKKRFRCTVTALHSVYFEVAEGGLFISKVYSEAVKRVFIWNLRGSGWNVKVFFTFKINVTFRTYSRNGPYWDDLLFGGNETGLYTMQ